MIPILKQGFLSEINMRINPTEYNIGEEFRSQYGVPDLLFYNFDNAILKKRLNNNIKPVQSKEVIKTLLLIQNRKKITLSFLQESLPFNKEILKNKVIKFLLDNNYLNKTLNDCDSYWVGENIYKTVMGNMYAVEAKVSNWKRGFYQAYRYKWFSNFSFLAMHSKYIRPAKNQLGLFEKYNIGLISVDSDTCALEVLRNPKKEKAYSPEMAAIAFEKLFATYLEKKADSQFAQSSRLTI